MRSYECLKALRRFQLKCAHPYHPTHGFHEHFEPEQLLWLARVSQVIEDAFFREKRQTKYKNSVEFSYFHKAKALMEGKEIIVKDGYIQSLELDCFAAGVNHKPIIELYNQCKGFSYEKFKKSYSIKSSTEQKKFWTKKDVDYLIKWFGVKTDRELSTALKRIQPSIRAKASKLGLKRGK